MANPYAHNASTTGGGNGSWWSTTTNTTSVSLPNMAQANKFSHTYIVTSDMLSNIAAYLWSDDTTNPVQDVVNNFTRKFTGTDDSVIALYMIPITPTTSGTTVSGNNTDYGITFGSNRTDYVGKLVTKAVQVKCGSIDVEEYSGSFLDYNDNTQLSLFLPYIGTVQLDANIVMGHKLTVTYNVDLLTGNCVANVFVRLDGKDDTLMYSFDGNCSYQLPTSSINYADMIGTTIGAGLSALGALI